MDEGNRPKKFLKAAVIGFTIAAAYLGQQLCSPGRNVPPQTELQASPSPFRSSSPMEENLRKLGIALTVLRSPSPFPTATPSLASLIAKEFPNGSLECPDVFIGESPGPGPEELYYLLGERKACEYGINVTFSACNTPLTEELWRLRRDGAADSILSALRLMGEEDMTHQDNPHVHLNPLSTYLDRRLAGDSLAPDPDCVGRNLYLNKIEFLTLQAFISLVHENPQFSGMVHELPGRMKDYVEGELLRMAGRGNIPPEEVLGPGQSSEDPGAGIMEESE